MTGFHVCDDYGEQQLIAHDAVLWCDKRGSRWRAGDFDAPPPKSKLLAAEPSWAEQYFAAIRAVGIPKLDGAQVINTEVNVCDNERDPSAATDWRKA